MQHPLHKRLPDCIVPLSQYIMTSAQITSSTLRGGCVWGGARTYTRALTYTCNDKGKSLYMLFILDDTILVFRRVNNITSVSVRCNYFLKSSAASDCYCYFNKLVFLSWDLQVIVFLHGQVTWHVTHFYSFDRLGPFWVFYFPDTPPNLVKFLLPATSRASDGRLAIPHWDGRIIRVKYTHAYMCFPIHILPFSFNLLVLSYLLLCPLPSHSFFFLFLASRITHNSLLQYPPFPRSPMLLLQ